MTGAPIAVCVLPVLFFRAHRAASLRIRVLAIVLVVLAAMGLLLAVCCCIFLVNEGCIYGNIEGKQQEDHEEPPPPPPQEEL
ncbi:hypothetical protein BAE44_0010251 [Dichanthelium oligosanthes]|uniref:Uncharacterized protein n=1 Tax=Dichanthelium oligosanthes TaxID=888268 RepID=A0A1E5VUG0_9POAL|nr:hypothetical protein BAE44_0010251 [Dichanthelium oligosanthes]